MNVSYCTYLANGAIQSLGSCDSAVLDKLDIPPGCMLKQVSQPVFPIGWYIDITQSPPVETARPDFSGTIDKTAIAADGTDTATLSNLPNPSQVTVIGPNLHTTESVTAGTFAFSSATAGLFKIYVDAFPAKMFSTAVKAS